MIRRYIQAAMEHAKYEILQDDGTYYGEIKECPGVYSNAPTLEKCRDEWSKSIAVGSRSFVQTVKEFLGIRAKGRDLAEGGQGYQLREAAADYKPLFEDENEDIGLGNAYFWDLNAE